MEKVCGVYKVVNTLTNDFYIGSSKDVLVRWANHKCPSRWKQHPNNPMYLDMQKYGVDKFRFQILAPVMSEYLTQVEQRFIEMLHPTYNNYRANILGVAGYKVYRNRLCEYNGKTLTLHTLSERFRRAGIKHPCLEAKKYLIREGLGDAE